MHIDDISFKDISIFNFEKEQSVFSKLNFTKTAGGKETLKNWFQHPFHSMDRITCTQQIIQTIYNKLEQWPEEISNGTIVVMAKYLDYPVDAIDKNPHVISAFMYRIFHSADYAVIKFSVEHFIRFIHGLKKICTVFENATIPDFVQDKIDVIKRKLDQSYFQTLLHTPIAPKLSQQKLLSHARHCRYEHKSDFTHLIEIYFELDAWYSMAKAMDYHKMVFPKFEDKDVPVLQIEGLFHVLVQQPVPYDIGLNPSQNFLFLTGANMSGKSTLIKSVGVAVFLAHLGMGVPASQMKLTLFDGLISNINVEDNIAKGESYFFNEVQRIKKTIERINNKQKWLVLIDELFKGTNIEDAMKCSVEVINGLSKIKTSQFILSTHLYEIGRDLKHIPNISFKYFDTQLINNELIFPYQLKDGISNDRIGYFILQKEGVVNLLNKL